jgi:hypothetical protein
LLPAKPGSPTRFETAKESSTFQFPSQSSPTRLLAAMLP